MGYQNNNRPTSKKLLETDIKFDFSDLFNDIKHDRLSKDDLLEAVSFVKETFEEYVKLSQKRKTK